MTLILACDESLHQTRRETLDHVPPVEYEEQHYRSITVAQQPLPA
jgi:hypothetical protein